MGKMKLLRKPLKWGWAAFAGGAAIFCLAFIGIANAQVTIGDLGSFALLADDGTLAVGNHTILTGGGDLGAVYADITIGGNNTSIAGDAIASMFDIFPPGATILLQNYATVLGSCVTDGGEVTLDTGAGCTHAVIDTAGDPAATPFITLLGDAVNQEEAFDSAVLCQTPTQTLGAITLAASQKSTITDTVPGGLNVITTPSITLGNSSTLTLSGGSGDTLILRTPGTITVGSSAKIVLTGGLTPSNVWISSTTEFVGFHAPANPPTTIIGSSSTINGTIHGGETCGLSTGVTINGALVCDYGITAGQNLTLHFSPAIGISLPACPI